jgi:hypothetical protein
MPASNSDGREKTLGLSAKLVCGIASLSSRGGSAERRAALLSSQAGTDSTAAEVSLKPHGFQQVVINFIQRVSSLGTKPKRLREEGQAYDDCAPTQRRRQDSPLQPTLALVVQQ